MSYSDVVTCLADDLDARCQDALEIVVLDGIPATGKSALARELARKLEARGRCVATIENDWFIARAIRSPAAIVWGLAVALSPVARGTVEQQLLRRFLDTTRLRVFQDQLVDARIRLRRGETAELLPDGAFWNLHIPRPWASESAAAGLMLRSPAIVLIEGTLTTATYRDRFPDLTSVRVRVSPPVARERFWARNEDPTRRRNTAFSTLALTTTPLRLAAQLLDRYPATFEVDLDSFDSPTVRLTPAFA